MTYKYVDENGEENVPAEAPTNNYTYSVGQQVPIAAMPDDVTVGGGVWKFQYWTVDGVHVSGRVPMVEGGLEIVGVWKYEPDQPAEYGVTYKYVDENGEENVPAEAPTNNYTYSVGQQVPIAAMPDDVTVGGGVWKFQYWTVDGVHVSGRVPMVEGGLEIVGVWKFEADAPEELNYTVTFDSKGGTAVPAQTVKEGEKADEPADPTRSGYTFQGWYLNGEKYDFNTPVTADITLTAQWSEKESGGSTVTPREYTLRYETNGGSKIASTTHSYGKVVQLTRTPIREGYTFTGWYADARLTKEITEIKMTSDKTVYAGWEKTDVPSDLNGDDHFAYIIGRDDGLVHPTDYITREEVATVFFRLLNADTREENLSDSSIFPDVADDRWSNTAISTLADLGILEGYTDGTFGPARSITRAEFATIAARFSSKNYSGDTLFDDIEGHWAENYINRAATVGWVVGDNGSFRPNDYITRAEAMTLINRVLSRLPQSAEDLHEDMIVWPDNKDESKWYYLAVQEATNSHEFKTVKGDEVWTEINKVPNWTIYEQ